ncbi:MAG: hypothetical protein JO078_09265 [Candidatus Eremiobacteraeota bacterium]|nr:hypothetical protein [Candidatus Eremiobacteraeota bacterium]MBV9055661.1 hypothetical protein [Candidatus Eremiobacteraeota bacterium]MBV9700299.1 hypothetical protein [Candidatus Eremiobacteraeota bacterium]
MQEDKSSGRSYSDADAAADLAAYLSLKRIISIRSLVGVAVVALLVVPWLPVPALALATGGLCGVLNAQLTGGSGERLLKNRNVGLFVLSSFLRIGVFGIVPVAFAVHGPWWSMAWYFAGFFLPLALFAVGAVRAFERK